MRFLLAFLAALAAPCASAEVYHWVDDAGRVNISSRPPVGRPANATAIGQKTWATEPTLVSLPPPEAPPATMESAALATVVRIAEKAPVTMYMASWCAYCRQARAYLASRKIDYREVDVESSASAGKEFRGAGGRGVPLILVGGERLHGFSKESLDPLLRRGGY
jgi:glutaredoxin